MRDVEWESDGGGEEDADDERAGDFAGHQDDGDEQADESDGRFRGMPSAGGKRRVGKLSCDDDVGVDESDEGDEEADACAGGEAKGFGDGVHDGFAQAAGDEKEGDEAVENDQPHRDFPGAGFEGDPDDDGVETHTAGEGDGKVGGQPHEDRANAGGESSACADGGGDIWGHAGAGENLRVDEKDVGHREEGGDGAAEFAGDGGVAGAQVESSEQRRHERV